MNEPTKLPEASINNDIDALEGFASTSMGDDRAAATAGRLRAHLAHQRAVMEAMAEHGVFDFELRDRWPEIWKLHTHTQDGVIAHFEAQVKGDGNG